MDYKRYGLNLRHWLSWPFVWVVLFPLLILDLFVEIYHRICFPLYRLEYVKRSEYIRLDRYKLPYLTWADTINCLYCEYANGLLHYVSEIAGRTEKYWCGIKHQPVKNFHPTEHQKDFLPYGDEKAFKKYCKLQRAKNKK
jgi:hypothetical protein